jgi:TRAP-type mannitol/chloroaromatic compound transport system permease small subunit
MITYLDNMAYPILIIGAVLMLAAPFTPMPHVIEKVIMLMNGRLTKPIDIFDLFFHLIPTILLVIKIVRDILQRSGS